MNKELSKIVKKISGSVLAIGVDDSLSNELNSNEKIIELDILNLYKKKKGKIKNSKRIKFKKINIKKLRKIYKKKGIDYILANYEEIKKYMRYFIKDSVYLNKNTLYLYGISNDDVKDIVLKYKRYDVLVKTTNKNDYFIIEIDNKNSKNNKVKDILYFIYDTTILITDIIGDILIN